MRGGRKQNRSDSTFLLRNASQRPVSTKERTLETTARAPFDASRVELAVNYGWKLIMKSPTGYYKPTFLQNSALSVQQFIIKDVLT
jgi:hypothetical protein